MGLFLCFLLSQKTETLGLLLISCCGIDRDKNPKYISDFMLTVELKSSQHLDSVKTSTVVAGFEPISGNLGSEKLKTLLSSCLPSNLTLRLSQPLDNYLIKTT